MATIEATFVQGDTAPAITAQIHDAENVTIPLNLTGSTVKFQMRKPDDRKYTVDSLATVTNASQGLVSYQWAANDLAVPGEYDVQWEVTYSDLRVQTTYAPNRILIRRQ